MYVSKTAAMTFSFSSACFFFYNYDLLQPPLSRPKARFISWYCAFKASCLMESCLLNCLTNKKLLERSFRTILQPHVVNFSQKMQHVLWPFLLSDVRYYSQGDPSTKNWTTYCRKISKIQPELARYLFENIFYWASMGLTSDHTQTKNGRGSYSSKKLDRMLKK